MKPRVPAQQRALPVPEAGACRPSTPSGSCRPASASCTRSTSNTSRAASTRAPTTGRYAYYPDTLVGTDSHTTMINGIGVVGWGVGGIEAEAAMLGQPVYMLTPRRGRLRAHRQAARRRHRHRPRALPSPQILRSARRWWASSSSSSARAPPRSAVPDRATIGNMAPEYSATMGFFPVDDHDRRLPRRHRPHQGGDRSASRPTTRRRACSACPAPGDIDYTKIVRARPGHRRRRALAGPKRPQDRIDLGHPWTKFSEHLASPTTPANQPAESSSRYAQAPGRRQRGRGLAPDARGRSRWWRTARPRRPLTPADGAVRPRARAIGMATC